MVKVESLVAGTVFVTEEDRTGITVRNEDLEDEAHIACFLEPDERMVVEKFRATTQVRALFPLYPVVDGFDDLVSAMRNYLKQNPGVKDMASFMLSEGTGEGTNDVVEAISELCKFALAQAGK